MIILHPNCSLSRGIVARDEAALAQKINDKEAVVIIPCEYDIVSMDIAACGVLEIEKVDDESMTATEKVANKELHDLASKKRNDGLDALLYVTKTFNDETETLSKEDIDNISEDVYKAVRMIQEAIKGFRV